MPSAENSVVINRPAQEVFDYLADGTNEQQWRKGVLEVTPVSPTPGVGATYRQVLSGPGGRKIAGDYRITGYEPPRLIAFEVIAGPARPTGVFELTEDGPETTTVRFSLDLTPRGLMKLLAPMIAAQMKREVAALDNVKTVLEQRPPR